MGLFEFTYNADHSGDHQNTHSDSAGDGDGLFSLVGKARHIARYKIVGRVVDTGTWDQWEDRYDQVSNGRTFS